MPMKNKKNNKQNKNRDGHGKVTESGKVKECGKLNLGGYGNFTFGDMTYDGSRAGREPYMQYAYGLDLDSSFTGEDELKIELEAGNASGELANMDSAINTSGVLTAKSILYNIPHGNFSLTAGPLFDQDDVVSATPSAYSDSFRLSALPYSLVGAQTGPGVGVSWSNDSGMNASFSIVAADGDDSSKGILTSNGNDVTTVSLGYDGSGFGGGLVYAKNDGDASASAGYDSIGVGVYYIPDSIPATISVAYDMLDPSVGDSETDFFMGVDYAVGPGTIHVAYNSTSSDGTLKDQTGLEINYSYDLNDNMRITPGLFTFDVDANRGEDVSGLVVDTAFKF